jgi:hypothetical protein
MEFQKSKRVFPIARITRLYHNHFSFHRAKKRAFGENGMETIAVFWLPEGKSTVHQKRLVKELFPRPSLLAPRPFLFSFSLACSSLLPIIVLVSIF